MSEFSSNSEPLAPDVDPGALKEIAAGVFVIGDRRIPAVPNIGIIVGNDAALIVDTRNALKGIKSDKIFRL